MAGIELWPPDELPRFGEPCTVNRGREIEGGVADECTNEGGTPDLGVGCFTLAPDLAPCLEPPFLTLMLPGEGFGLGLPLGVFFLPCALSEDWSVRVRGKGRR